VHVARDAVALSREETLEDVDTAVRVRKAYDPEVAALFDVRLLSVDPAWDAVLERAPQVATDPDAACRANRALHRPEVDLHAGPLDRGRRDRRGRGVAAAPRRGRGAPGGAAARPRPRRRLDGDLGEARVAQQRPVGAGAPASPVHGPRARALHRTRRRRPRGCPAPRAARRLRLPGHGDRRRPQPRGARARRRRRVAGDGRAAPAPPAPRAGGRRGRAARRGPGGTPRRRRRRPPSSPPRGSGASAPARSCPPG